MNVVGCFGCGSSCAVLLRIVRSRLAVYRMQIYSGGRWRTEPGCTFLTQESALRAARSVMDDHRRSAHAAAPSVLVEALLTHEQCDAVLVLTGAPTLLDGIVHLVEQARREVEAGREGL